MNTFSSDYIPSKILYSTLEDGDNYKLISISSSLLLREKDERMNEHISTDSTTTLIMLHVTLIIFKYHFVFFLKKYV